MPLIAGNVIDAARDRHVAFSREHAPQGVCLRFLSQQVRALLSRVAEIDEDALRVEMNVVMPLADFAAGIALPANRAVVAVTGEETGANPRNFDLAIVPASHRNDINTPLSAVWQIGNTLYLRGAASDWTNFGSIAVSTIPVPPALLTDKDVLPVDDTAERALADALAVDLASRLVGVEGIPAFDINVLSARASASADSYLDEVRNRASGVFETRDVMHYYS
jgi:hypothetical protein